MLGTQNFELSEGHTGTLRLQDRKEFLNLINPKRIMKRKIKKKNIEDLKNKSRTSVNQIPKKRRRNVESHTKKIVGTYIITKN